MRKISPSLAGMALAEGAGFLIRSRALCTSGGKYALSMRTKMRAFLVAAKVADCEAWETVTEEEVAEADEEAKIKAAQACRGDTEVIWGPGAADADVQ